MLTILIINKSMETYLNPSNIMFVFGILGVIFSIYSYFRNPQIAMDKQQALDKEEVEGKAGLLAQQVQWEKEANEKKFNDMQMNIDKAFTMALNHSHTVEDNVKTLTGVVNTLVTQVSNLGVVLDERLPRK